MFLNFKSVELKFKVIYKNFEVLKEGLNDMNVRN